MQAPFAPHSLDMHRNTNRLSSHRHNLSARFAGVVSVCGCTLVLSAQVTPTMLDRHVYVMGTRASLAVTMPSRKHAIRSLDRMVAALERTERDLSTWRSASLLSRLNRQPVGEPWRAPPWLCELVSELETWSRRTDGAFDPTVGSLVAAWGLRGEARRPEPSVLLRARAASGFRHMAVTASLCVITRLANVTMDAGAFGKGVALDRVAALDESGLIDLGGQVAAFGPPPHQGWPVVIAHPEHRQQPVAQLRLTTGSIAVSGGSERDHRTADGRIGHIIDPRTGEPVSRRLAVVVWHEQALVADLLSTALYVMGHEQGFEWADARGFAACFLLPGGGAVDALVARASAASVGHVELRLTAAFRRRFTQRLDSDLRVRVGHGDKWVGDVEEREWCVGQGRNSECLGHERAARVPGDQHRRERSRVLQRP